MAGPWENYAPAADSSAKPWEKYGSAAPPAAPAEPPAEKLPPPLQVPTGILGPQIGAPHIGAGEAALNMGTGMIAKPVSDIMGLAATAKDYLSGNKGGDPAGFKRHIQESMTYQPRTEAGQDIAQYNPLALIGKGVHAVGGMANQLVAPPQTSGPAQSAVGNAFQEGTEQAAGFLLPVAASKAGAVGGSLKNTARDMMQRALKPSLKAQQTGKAAAAVDTLLDEGVNVTKGGVGALNDRIASLNDRISTAIENSPATVNKAQVGKRMVGLIDKFKKQVTPMDDVAAIQKAWDEFMNHPLLNGRDIPVKTAQEMKKGTYKALGDKSYGELKGAEIEAQKTLARGLKEEIAKAVPEISPLNAQESKLLNALSLTERRVLMEANKNPIGLGWLTANPVKFAGWMADRSGLFKSIVARMINKGAEVAPPALSAAGPAGVGVNAYAQQIPPPPQQPDQ